MRYTGPNNKKSRRYKISILENNKEFIKGKKRITAPGQHGMRNQKLTNFGTHLYEKQKLKYIYGLSEKQLKRTFEKSKKLKGVLGENFLILLESRLDNIIYRSGIANTRRQARQIVNHGHILVNNRKVNIPSYQVKVGDEFTLKDKLSNNIIIRNNLEKRKGVEFVEFDSNEFKGRYVRVPNRDEIAGQINESLVVEFYNK